MQSKESPLQTLAPGVTRLRAANPSPMTGTGTNTYILHGPNGVVVIDPGPALPAHFAALRAAIGAAPLAAILVTHAHLDHSALATPLAAATQSPVFAFGTAIDGRSPTMQRLAAEGMSGGGEGIDTAFTPDHRIADGEQLALAGLTITALHTPGHMGGHLCFALNDSLFSGDHVMGWSTSLVSPPDGDMRAYRDSLAKLAAQRWQRFWPGHGEPINTPATRLTDLAQHRAAREVAILAALATGAHTATDIAARIYTDTPKSMLAAAARNTFAHLIDLKDKNTVTTTDPLSPHARFHLI